jgi:hypothetical protein
MPIDWESDVPWYMKDMVVAPFEFTVHQDYEILADRTVGNDLQDEACYCAYRYVETRLQSEDDDVVYVAPVYAQTISSWRMLNGYWLVLTKTYLEFDTGKHQSAITISKAMPR